jgi:hypothetical protein
MPKFSVMVEHKLVLTTEVTVSAKDEEAAVTKVQAMVDDGKFAGITKWEAGDKYDWEESEHELEVLGDEVTEL